MSGAPTDPVPVSAGRENALLDALVRLTGTLVGDFDVLDVLDELTHDCVVLLAVDAAALVLADQRGGLEVMSSTNEAAHQLELVQLRSGQGPCVDSFRTARQVHAADIADGAARWPRFAAAAQRFGFRGAHALPLRCRDHTLGAVNLFSTAAGPLPAADLLAGQALADVASVALLQDRALGEVHRITEHLQQTLNNRVIVEQAKGALGERAGLDPEEIYIRLRRYARAHNLKVGDVARQVMARTVDTTTMLGPDPHRRGSGG